MKLHGGFHVFISFLKTRMLVYFPTNSFPSLAKGCSGRKDPSPYSGLPYAPVEEKAHRQRGTGPVYRKPMNCVEMVNAKVMGWDADIILLMIAENSRLFA